MRATLRQKRPGELEVLPAGDKLLNSLRQEMTKPWTLSDGPHELVIVRRGPAQDQLEWVRPFLERYGSNLKRLSWRPEDPHLLIVLRLSRLPDEEAARLFQEMRRVAGEQSET